MGRHKGGLIGKENYKKISDYHYDYPENREISEGITRNDKMQMGIDLNLSYGYIIQWCAGKRKSEKIRQYALKLKETKVDTEA